MKDLYSEIYGDSWKENIVLASVPLWKYENELPIANASGCLIDYASCRFLLSIAHGSIAESEWRAEVKSVDEHEGDFSVVYQPIKMNSLTQFNFIEEKQDFTEPKLVDFTYRRLTNDFTSLHVIGFVSESQFLQAERTIFKPNFNKIKPSSNGKYGFYGNVRFTGINGRFLKFEHRLEHDLKFIEKQGDFFVFRLPHKYGSHANYQGCSGAPIIDADNNIVALVSFGEKSTNSIYGIDFSKYKSALEIDVKP